MAGDYNYFLLIFVTVYIFLRPIILWPYLPSTFIHLASIELVTLWTCYTLGDCSSQGAWSPPCEIFYLVAHVSLGINLVALVASIFKQYQQGPDSNTWDHFWKIRLDYVEALLAHDMQEIGDGINLVIDVLRYLGRLRIFHIGLNGITWEQTIKANRNDETSSQQVKVEAGPMQEDKDEADPIDGVHKQDMKMEADTSDDDASQKARIKKDYNDKEFSREIKLEADTEGGDPAEQVHIKVDLNGAEGRVEVDPSQNVTAEVNPAGGDITQQVKIKTDPNGGVPTQEGKIETDSDDTDTWQEVKVKADPVGN